MDGKTFNTFDTDNPTCPYCGSEWRDAWECGLGDGESDIRSCGDCGKEYQYTRFVSVSYCTEQRPAEPGKE